MTGCNDILDLNNKTIYNNLKKKRKKKKDVDRAISIATM